MKILNYSFLAILLLFGCVQNNKVKVSPPEKYKIQIEVYIDSLLSSYPGVLNNDITRESFSKIIRTYVESFRGKNAPFINDIPLTFERMLAYDNDGFSSNSGKYIVKFRFGADNNEAVNIHKLAFQVFTVMEKERASQLVENESYSVKGLFKDFANCKGSIILPSGRCFESFPSITSIPKSMNPDDVIPYIDLGSFVLDSLSFVLYKNK